jgi:lipid-A-disaccharide synthase
MTSGLDFVFTTNSPGELSSWVRVASRALRAEIPDARQHVALVPCPFASGTEAEYARRLPDLDGVIEPRETLRLLLGMRGFRPKEGLVVYLGGELWHASTLARRWRLPSLAYVTRASRQARPFDRLVVPCEQLIPALRKKGVKAPIEVVGDLMVDGVALTEDRAEVRRRLGLSPESRVVGLFPGSRAVHLRAALPVFLRTAELLAERVPGTEFLLVLSPFVNLAAAQQALDRPLSIGVERATGRFARSSLTTARGLEVRVTQGRPHESMQALDLAVSVPGTNTAELACAGVPMITVVSARAPLPRGGLGGLIELLPVGRLKDRLRVKEYLKFPWGVAQPNLRARRKLVPEVILQDSLAELVQTGAGWLTDDRQRQQLSRELRALMGETGAWPRLAAVIRGTVARVAKEELYA